MTSCPSHDTLSQFLPGGLPDELAAQVREHVRGCSRCQAVLDQLSDDAELRSWVPQARSAPLPANDGPALSQALDQLCLTCTPQRQSDTPPLAPRGSLSFLAPAQRPGDVGSLGPYAILAELGRGGMGIVLRAHDRILQRTVALKVLRPELADEQARARFVREAQATARVDHDHVVRIYSVINPPHGLPYFAMEYVEGRTLAQMIRSQKHLEPKQAVSIVVQVAQGLAAAHAAGLVHRDIKPSNILLDSVTVHAKITDFGLARLNATPSDWTRDGNLAGTPMYMSPEQAHGLDSLDARTDIYSLGVTLYEALTGELPFRGAPQMVLKQVADEEARPPRQLNDLIPPDVETICLKAMAKEPERRYQTAQELADDLQRWQRGEPIQARPAGPLERAWRWCRRNPRTALLSGSVFSLLVLVALGSTVAAALILQAKANADRERSAAEEARTIADQNAHAARQAQEQAATHARAAGAHFAQTLDTLNTLVFKVQQQLGSHPGTLPLRKEIVETALARLEEIAQSADKNPSSDRIMIVAHDRMGDLFYQLGRTAQARVQFERARAMAQALVAEDRASVQPRRDLAKAHDKLGDLAIYASDRKAADEHYRTALGIREALIHEQPEDAVVRRDLAVSYNKLGDVRMNSGNAAGACDLYEKALQLCEGSEGKELPLLLADLRFCYCRLGDAHMALYEFEAAAACYQQSLQHAQTLVEADSANALRRGEVAHTHLRLGHVNLRLAEYPLAETHYHKALAIWQDLATTDAQNAVATRNWAATYSNLGDAARCRCDLDAARLAYGKALALCEQLSEQDRESPQKLNDVLLNCLHLAETEDRAAQYQSAATWHQRGLDLYRRLEAEGKLPKMALHTTKRELEEGLRLYSMAATHGTNNLEWILAQEPALVRELLRLRALSLARHGQHQQAAQTAEELRRLGPAHSPSLWVVARTYALCSQSLASAPSQMPLSEEERTLQQKYTHAALEAAREAIELDPTSIQGTPLQPDLICLCANAEFKRFLQARVRSQSANTK